MQGVQKIEKIKDIVLKKHGLCENSNANWYVLKSWALQDAQLCGAQEEWIKCEEEEQEEMETFVNSEFEKALQEKQRFTQEEISKYGVIGMHDKKIFSDGAYWKSKPPGILISWDKSKAKTSNAKIFGVFSSIPDMVEEIMKVPSSRRTGFEMVEKNKPVCLYFDLDMKGMSEASVMNDFLRKLCEAIQCFYKELTGSDDLVQGVVSSSTRVVNEETGEIKGSSHVICKSIFFENNDTIIKEVISLFKEYLQDSNDIIDLAVYKPTPFRLLYNQKINSSGGSKRKINEGFFFQNLNVEGHEALPHHDLIQEFKMSLLTYVPSDAKCVTRADVKKLRSFVKQRGIGLAWFATFMKDNKFKPVTSVGLRATLMQKMPDDLNTIVQNYKIELSRDELEACALETTLCRESYLEVTIEKDGRQRIVYFCPVCREKMQAESGSQQKRKKNTAPCDRNVLKKPRQETTEQNADPIQWIPSRLRSVFVNENSFEDKRSTVILERIEIGKGHLPDYIEDLVLGGHIDIDSLKKIYITNPKICPNAYCMGGLNHTNKKKHATQNMRLIIHKNNQGNIDVYAKCCDVECVRYIKQVFHPIGKSCNFRRHFQLPTITTTETTLRKKTPLETFFLTPIGINQVLDSSDRKKLLDIYHEDSSKLEMKLKKSFDLRSLWDRYFTVGKGWTPPLFQPKQLFS